MARLRLLGVLVACAFFVGAAFVPPAHADEAAAAEGQPVSTDYSPEELFSAALELYVAGKFEQALPLFEQAAELTKSPNAYLYVGRCFDKLGRKLQAHTALRQSVLLAHESQQAKYERTREAAESELQVLELELSKIVVTLAKPDPSAQVRLNRELVDGAQLGLPIVVNPGHHKIVADADGQSTFTRTVVVNKGETRTVIVSFEPALSAPRTETVQRGGGVRLAGYAVTGLGVVGVAAFAVAGSMAKSDFNRISDECGGSRCTDSKYADEIDKGKNLQSIANVGLVAGAVGIVAGGLMIALGGPTTEEVEVGPPVADVQLLPGGAAMTFGGSF